MSLAMAVRRTVENRGGTGCRFLGKWFDPVQTSDRPLILLHADYPGITESMIHEFEAWTRGRANVVATGTVSPVHPYRLIAWNQDGKTRYLIDIKQEIRGNRHSYPTAFCFRPAMVYLPPDLSLVDYISDMQNHGEYPDLYPMDYRALLDQSLEREGFLIRAMNL